MDKQKQIEEIARIIAFDLCPNRHVHAKWGEEAQCYSDNNFAECTIIKNVVDKLYNAGCRKIPEGAVVLTREKYDEFLRQGAMIDFLKECNKEVRKETVEKFAERFKKKISSMIIELKANWATKEVEGFEKDVYELTCNCILNTLNTIKDFTIDEICKELSGVPTTAELLEKGKEKNKVRLANKIKVDNEGGLVDCHNCKHQYYCERTYLGGCTDGVEYSEDLGEEDNDGN